MFSIGLRSGELPHLPGHQGQHSQGGKKERKLIYLSFEHSFEIIVLVSTNYQLVSYFKSK